MPQAATYTMETFVADVRQIFATTKDPRTQAQEVARHMQELLRAPDGWRSGSRCQPRAGLAATISTTTPSLGIRRAGSS